MNQPQRIHGFDALRTIAMWLGIVLHAIIVYKDTPEPNWPHDDQWNASMMDWLYSFIHFFRMPLFFMVAGYFARFVIMRSGTDNFLLQRFKRIVIPFVAGMVLIVPLSLLPFHFYNFHYGQSLPAAEAWQHSLRQMLRWNGMAHLWFLYYLILFYGLSVGALFLVKKFPARNSVSGTNWLERYSLPWILGVTVVLSGLLYGLNMYLPPVYTGWKPTVSYLLYFGLFYGLGWLLQTNRNSLTALVPFGPVLTAIGLALSFYTMRIEHGPLTLSGCVAAAAQTVSLVLGLTGLFLRFFQRESAFWRYCSDAAYWVYLIHLSIVAAVQVGLLDSLVPGALRLPIVLIAAFSFSILSYHFLVRYTVIGTYLHGKRERKQKKSTITRKEATLQQA